MKKSFVVLFVAALLPVFALNAHSLQVVQSPPTPATTTKPSSAPLDEGLEQGSLEVTGFRFSGDLGAIPEAQLQALITTDKNKITTLKELHRVADKVERHLQTQHLLVVAKAWVPLQDVRDGIVEIRVLQGTVDGIQMDANFALRSESRGAIAAARAVLATGSAIHRERLEEAVYRVSDHVGAAARAVLVPAEGLGHYHVMFEVSLPSDFSGSIAIDNTGNAYTSAWHETLSFKVRDLSGHSDTLSLQSQLLTPNQRSLRLQFQAPLANAYRVGATVQATRYRLCCVFEPLEAHGETRVASFDLNRAWTRSRAFNFSTSVEFLRRALINRQLGQITSDHIVSQATFGMKADWSDADVSHYTYLNLSRGTVKLNASGSDVASNQNTIRTAGGYSKINYGYTRTQVVGKTSNVVFNLNGQWANKNLDSSETFLLGGMGAIRAYPSGESAGDQSLVAQFELHHNFSTTLRGFGFFDYGSIKLHKNTWPGLTGENTFALKGVGAGLVWKPLTAMELSLIAAYKLGRNPQANPNTGNDSDGRSDRYRIWGFANYHF